MLSFIPLPSTLLVKDSAPSIPPGRPPDSRHPLMRYRR